jgi:hypothetical protein
LIQEINDWLLFVGATMRIWLEGNAEVDRILIVVPEMGPVRGGYNLAHLPNSWEEAVRLRSLLKTLWNELITGASKNQPNAGHESADRSAPEL